MKEKLSILFNSTVGFPSKYTLADIGLAWIIFFSIVYQKLAPIGFGLMLVSLVLERKKVTTTEFLSFIKKGPALWFVMYFFLLVIGLLWTVNHEYALSKLENKMSFILLPMLLFFTVRKGSTIAWKQLFIYALLFALAMYEILALLRFIGNPAPSWQLEFLASRFTVFMHRSYFSCYLVIGIVLLFENIHSAIFKHTLAIIFFSFGVLQTESKAGVVCLFIVLSVQFYSILKSKQKKVNWFLGIGVLLFSLVFVINNPIKTRFETMLSALGNIQTKNNSSVESNTARILMWNASWQVWKKDLILGVGTGDYNDELIDYNKSNNNLGVAKEELNAHNQFLNTSVQLGLIGLIVLVMVFISTFSYSQKSIWQVLILTVFFINFFVESFIETQAGVVLFSTLLLLFFKKNETDQFELDAT